MKNLILFLYEWKHFTRSPFKIIALLLFVFASIYGLHNGASLYQKQKAEVEKIEQKIAEEKQKHIIAYKKGKTIPQNQPWINFGTSFWAINLASIYHFKLPSPAMVYSIGQSEQYGFYKRITPSASPYDTDLAEEIANPERLQTGTLDFTFALLFLMPLVLLVLLYNIKSAETEQGFMPLIEVQSASKNSWLLYRIGFYTILLALVIFVLIFYGAMLTNIFEMSSNAFGQTLLYSFLYLFLWSVCYYFILQKGKSIIGNTLIMTGVYLLFAFIIPATVHQYLSITKPANLMIDLIDIDRDKKQEIYDQPDAVLQAQLNTLFPEIVNSPLAKDNTKRIQARARSTPALINELKKESIKIIEQENQEKNTFIEKTFWFNPVSFFQNRFNAVAQTHFDDYQTYRNEIQSLVDKQIKVMVLDMWHGIKVDLKKYNDYYKILTKK